MNLHLMYFYNVKLNSDIARNKLKCLKKSILNAKDKTNLAKSYANQI